MADTMMDIQPLNWSTDCMSNEIIATNLEQLLEGWLKAEQNGIEFPVPFDAAWPMVGYSNKANAKRALVKLSEGIDFSSTLMKSNGGRASRSFSLSCDAFKQFCMIADTDIGRSIRLYFIDAEKKWKLVQKIAPEVAAQAELLNLQIELAKIETQKEQAIASGKQSDLQLIQFRHIVTTTMPEPIQQKILGYVEIKTIEYIDRTITSDGQQHSGIGITYLQRRYGFKSTKQTWDWLESIGCGKLSGHWESQLSAVERQSLPRELLPKLDELAQVGNRQPLLGE